MDDLAQQLNQFLQNPDSMRQLQTMLGSLGAAGASAAPPAEAPPAQAAPPPPADLSALAGALGALGGAPAGKPAGPPAAPAGADTLAMVSKLAPLLGRVNQEDDSTRLLRALRPLLSGPRQQKIDEAVKILQLMRLLPLLRDMGGLPGLL